MKNTTSCLLVAASLLGLGGCSLVRPCASRSERDAVVQSRTEAYDLMYSYLWEGATDAYFEQTPTVARGAIELCVRTMDEFLNEDFMPAKYLWIKGDLAYYLFDHALMHARLGKVYDRLGMPDDARREEQSGFTWYRMIRWPADRMPQSVATNLHEFLEIRGEFDHMGNPIRRKL